MPLQQGTFVGPYEIIGWIGAGGMGEVYRARDPRIGRDVAIKIIPESMATDTIRLQRFEQEARTAGQINHPNILAVHDVGVNAGAPYLVSELLEGDSLRHRLQAAPLSLRTVIDYARQVADGLAAAHDKGIVHRDIKPDNVFITNDGRVKILDFGIAKLLRPSDEATRHTGLPAETEAGTVIGTAGYMSPEQVRGEPVDARSDLFSFGAILYEMLAGRSPFTSASAAETMAAILKEDPPPLPDDVPPAVARIVARCLEKGRDMRFQSARDLAFGLEVLSGTAPATAAAAKTPRRRALVAALTVAVLGLGAWLVWPVVNRAAIKGDDPLANAIPKRFTDWDGTEESAEISPDGKFVAFLSDRAGEFDIWLSQVGTGVFSNLTKDFPPLSAGGAIVRKLGFNGDGTEIWFNAGEGKPLMLMPMTGGIPRPFPHEGANTPAWSADGDRLVYVFKPNRDDPIFVARSTGADATQILAPGALKNNNPVWSPDNEWIYFVRGADPQEETNVDLWRLRVAGGLPEQLTKQEAAVNFPAFLNPRTLLYVSRAADWSGPWLWSLDIDHQVSRRVLTGIDQYTSVSASRDGRRVVTSVANPTATLWRVAVPGRETDKSAAQTYPLPGPTGRALAPRFGGTSLFYLSDRGAGNRLWKVENGHESEVWRETDGALSEPAAVARDGQRVVVVVREAGKRHLSIVSADGTNPRRLAPSIDVEGVAGQGAADWSPDGTSIVTGGSDSRGPALFKIPVDGGDPVRLREGKWANPVWSPDGNLIVYVGRSVVGQAQLLAVRPDGTAVDLPEVMVRPGGYRFLPSGRGLVYVPRIQGLDFWLLDIATLTTRQLTHLDNRGALRTFDLTADGKDIVFDRSRQNSDIVLVDLPK